MLKLFRQHLRGTISWWLLTSDIMSFMLCGSLSRSEGENSSVCVPQIQVFHPSGHQLRFRSNLSAPECNNSHCLPVSKCRSVGGLLTFSLTVFVLVSSNGSFGFHHIWKPVRQDGVFALLKTNWLTPTVCLSLTRTAFQLYREATLANKQKSVSTDVLA